jgi:hypothetical protein
MTAIKPLSSTVTSSDVNIVLAWNKETRSNTDCNTGPAKAATLKALLPADACSGAVGVWISSTVFKRPRSSPIWSLNVLTESSASECAGPYSTTFFPRQSSSFATVAATPLRAVYAMRVLSMNVSSLRSVVASGPLEIFCKTGSLRRLCS